MKRMIALLLCLCFALAGCAQTVDPNGETPASESSIAPVAAASFEKLALGLAALPDLPEAPDENALWDALNALDVDKLGEKAYNEAYDKLWNEFSAQQAAYFEAVQALRGEGVDAALTPALLAYTLKTARALFAGANDENVVYSPANLYLALCMLAETANGESRAQLLELLGLSDVEQARAAANSIFRTLYRDSEDGKTLLANSLWLNEKADYHQDVVDTLAKDYYASAFRAAMGEAATDEAIHEWINANTNDLLADAASALKTDPDTLMMLISTLYFKGSWSDAFEENATSEDTFTSANDAQQKVDFMHNVKNGSYCRGENFTIASLPFRDGISMWFLLPDEGVSLADLLADELPDFEALLADPDRAEIHWSVPKFDVDSDLDLVPALQALGVTDIFDASAADFSPLSDVPAVVSAVKHAARVTVDEEGCEAAAFTAIMMEATSALIDPLPVVEMNLNRPFGFLITGTDGLPLFMSVVNTME